MKNPVPFWERVFKRAVKDTRRGNPASIVSGMEAMRPVPVGLAQVARTGRSSKLATGNISWRIMRQLIFCLRARKWCLAYSIRESKPFVRRDSSANDVCSIAEIIPFPASMIRRDLFP